MPGDNFFLGIRIDACDRISFRVGYRMSFRVGYLLTTIIVALVLCAGYF